MNSGAVGDTHADVLPVSRCADADVPVRHRACGAQARGAGRRCSIRRPTATRRGFTSPTVSTSVGRPTRTWPSAAAARISARREPRSGGGHRDHSRGAFANEEPRTRRTRRTSAIQSDERHPVDAGQIHGPSRQRKLLTYFPPGAWSKPSNWKNAMVSPLRCGHPSLAACRCRRQRPRDVRCRRRSTGQMGRGSARTHPRRSRA